MNKLTLALALFVGCLSMGSITSAFAEELKSVTGIVDGVTVTLDSGETVRLLGVTPVDKISADKPLNYYSEAATDYTTSQLFGKKVRLDFDEQKVDDLGRVLAYLYTEEGRLFNLELIRSGYASASKRFPSRQLSNFQKIEMEAKLQKRGLWSDSPQPITVSPATAPANAVVASNTIAADPVPTAQESIAPSAVTEIAPERAIYNCNGTIQNQPCPGGTTKPIFIERRREPPPPPAEVTGGETLPLDLPITKAVPEAAGPREAPKVDKLEHVKLSTLYYRFSGVLMGQGKIDLSLWFHVGAARSTYKAKSLTINLPLKGGKKSFSFEARIPAKATWQYTVEAKNIGSP